MILDELASLERILRTVNQHVMHAQDVLQDPVCGGIVSGGTRILKVQQYGLPHTVSHAPPPRVRTDKGLWERAPVHTTPP